MAKECVTGEQQHSDNLAAADAGTYDAGSVTTAEDSQQKLEDTCEQLFTRLKEARRNVGRPEDFRVNYQNSADVSFQL